MWCNWKLNKLFIAQKKIIRVLFGNRERYNDKFKTCVRARPYQEQKLPREFYVKEPSKPLFNEIKILNLRNLYYYHCANEIFKILKFRSPIKIHSTYRLSSRGQKQLYILTPPPSDTFVYNSSMIWNKVRNMLKITDSSTTISYLKTNLKKHLLENQSLGDSINWIEPNFACP